MKLYNLDMSPYAARVRMQVRMKNLPVQFEPPPEALRTPEFYARFPLGKIPVLVTEEGELAESLAIMEYLEDRFPEPPLRPADPFERGRMRMLCRYTDLVFGPTFVQAFLHLIAPQGEEAPSLQPAFDCLPVIERVIPGAGRPRPQLHDIALGSSFFFLQRLCQLRDERLPLDTFPGLQAWWQWFHVDAAFAATTREMNDAVEQRLAAVHSN